MESFIVSEDGVAFREGDIVYNYYDRVVCIIGEIDSQGWFDTIVGDTHRGAVLNGERICSLEFAKKKGWIQ